MKRITYYGLQNDLFKCDLCGFASASDGRVVSHMQIEHGVEHDEAIYHVVFESVEPLPSCKGKPATQWYFKRKSFNKRRFNNEKDEEETL